MGFDEIWDLLKIFIGVVVFIMILFFTVGGIVSGFVYFGSITESKVYNEKYGTHYTAKEFFWAGDTIKSYINQGEQKTYNVKIENKDNGK